MQSDEITTVTIDVIVKETGKTLCTVQLLETATIYALKREIVEKRRGTIATGLSITARQCTKDVIDVIINGRVVEYGPRQEIRNFGILGSRRRKAVTITFVRAYAFHNRAHVKQLLYSLDCKTQGHFPQDLMLMALNMGTNCTYDEALRNLYRHTARVFETIL